MQPYQQAAKESVKQAKAPYQQAMSLLSYYVPANLAVKGLSKLNPTISKFAKLATESGYDNEEIVSHLREQAEKVKEPAKSLFMQMLGGNEPPNSLPQHLQFQIDAIQNIANKFEKEGKTIESPEVRKLTQRLKNILQGKGMLSGSDMQPQQGASMMQQGQSMGQSMQPQQMGAMQQQGMQQPMQGGQQGAGQGQQALMAILQKIQAQRGA